MTRWLVSLLAMLVVLVIPSRAWAHKPSDAYLVLRPAGTTVDGRFDVALRDLDDAITLDRDGNGAITWGEVRTRRADIETYVYPHLSLSIDGGPCTLAPTDFAVADHSDGSYVSLGFSATCPAGDTLGIGYTLFFDRDPQHHGLLRLVGKKTTTAIFTRDSTSQQFDLRDVKSSFLSIVKDGIFHILSGADHILFLLALLLPSVFVGGAPAKTLRPVLVDVTKTVSAFTVAHSITLSMAALGVVSPPSRLIESGIAASVVLAAMNNVRPVLLGDRWTAAFSLGLLHGFGFSSVLTDLGLSRSEIGPVLFGFNVGVEIGQLGIVLVVLPLAFLLRRFRLYPPVMLRGGSLVIAAIAAVWLVERAFAIPIFSRL